MRIRRALPAIALLLAACGGGGIEVTPAHPLGTLADFAKALDAIGRYEHSVRKFTNPETFAVEPWERFEALTVHAYEERTMSSAGVKHLVLIGVDEAGEVQAIGGSFNSKSPLYSTSGSETQKLLARFWVTVQGGEPTFEKLNYPGIDVDEYLRANFSTPTVAGIWHKQSTSKMISHSRSIWDMIFIYRK